MVRESSLRHSEPKMQQDYMAPSRIASAGPADGGKDALLREKDKLLKEKDEAIQRAQADVERLKAELREA